jgi:hypothetical protein
MQATFPAFRLNRNALFYMGLFALLAFFLLAPSTHSPPKAPAALCRMRAG